MRLESGSSRALVTALALLIPAAGAAQPRLLQPEDLFRVERVGAITWSPDGGRATVEIRRPGRWLDGSIPTARIGVVDAATGALQTISPSTAAHVGFFGAAWSPDGRRVAFLSLDTNGVIHPWVWSSGPRPATRVRGITVQDAQADPSIVQWRDAHRLILVAKTPGAVDEGPMFFRVTRGRKVADAWRVAREGRAAAVTVFDAGVPQTIGPTSRLVIVDVRTGTATTLAAGQLRRARVSADGATISFRREQPSRVADFFGPDAQGDAAYDRVNVGGTSHHIDSRTGADVPAPDTTRAKPPAGRATLRADNDPATGTALTLVRAGRRDTVIWRGNAWVRDIRAGRAEAVTYAALDSTRLTGWILYPPGYAPGTPIPAVTIVYPGSIFTERPPSAFSLLTESFEHPQMFAALGYAIVLPSMPEADRPMQGRALEALANGVLPLVDTLVRRGIVDSARIAVLGQSAGGNATLGLITRTDRFRTAIASASYGDLRALYGAFYGQYRYGDGGNALRAQLLRMLQFERGYYGAAATPWESFERYEANSPIADVAAVKTPLLLIHGDMDFIPVQQAEQFFTALYRQDKRARLVRYAGEGHTISARENVLDLWRQMSAWLRETMPR